MSGSDEEAVEFGQRLREIRRRQDLEQAALAEIARVPTSSISHFERGKHKPSLDTLIRLADGLDVSIDYLVGRADSPSVHKGIYRQVPLIPMTPSEVEGIEDYIEWLKMTGRYREDWARVVKDKEPD